MPLAFVLLAVAAWAQPPDAGCALARAVQLHQSGDLDGAIREYRACVAAEPDRVEARSNLGAVYARLGRFEDAIAEYKEALRHASPEIAARLRFNLALAYYKSFQIAEAAAELEGLRAQPVPDANIALLLADCRLRLGEYREAIEILTPIERSQPDNPAVDYALGMALIRDGRVAEGQLRVDRILRRGNSAEGHLLLGTALLAAHRYPGAVQEFAQAVAIDPNLPSLQSFYGQALLATGDVDGAAAAFRKELAGNPNDYDANFQLAAILAHRGKQEEARLLLQKAAQVRPASAEARQALAKGFRFESAPPDLGGVAAGTPAPAFGDFDPGRMAKPALLVFGSYTCPRFRSAAAELNRLFGAYGGRVDFRLIYIREAHPGGGAGEAAWQSSINQREGISMPAARDAHEKREHANLCVRRLNIRFPAAIDAMDAKAESAYDAWPSRVYLVRSDGRVAFNSRLGELDFHPRLLEAAIRETLNREGTNGGSR